MESGDPRCQQFATLGVRPRLGGRLDDQERGAHRQMLQGRWCRTFSQGEWRRFEGNKGLCFVVFSVCMYVCSHLRCAEGIMASSARCLTLLQQTCTKRHGCGFYSIQAQAPTFHNSETETETEMAGRQGSRRLMTSLVVIFDVSKELPDPGAHRVHLPRVSLQPVAIAMSA